MSNDLSNNHYNIFHKKLYSNSEDLFGKYCKCDGNKKFPIIVCKNIKTVTTLKKIFEVSFIINKMGKFLLTDSSLDTIDTHFLPKNIGFEFISVKTTNLLRLDINVFNDSLPILKRLEIIHNNLEVLPIERNSKVRGLQHLDLYYNCLTTIPDYAFEKLTELKTVDLSFNQISYVGSFAFYFNDKLQHLDLKYNRLKVVNNFAFALNRPNPRLTLNLSNNKMFHLSEGVFSRQSPLLLNLTSNSLTKLEEKHFLPILMAIISNNGFIIVYSKSNQLIYSRLEISVDTFVSVVKVKISGTTWIG